MREVKRNDRNLVKEECSEWGCRTLRKNSGYLTQQQQQQQQQQRQGYRRSSPAWEPEPSVCVVTQGCLVASLCHTWWLGLLPFFSSYGEWCVSVSVCQAVWFHPLGKHDSSFDQKRMSVFLSFLFFSYRSFYHSRTVYKGNGKVNA